jgi:hypothetical protein
MKDRNSKPERGGEWELIKILLEGDIGRVWESSDSEKIAPELQIHEISPWSGSTVELGFCKMFGTAPDFTLSL